MNTKKVVVQLDLNIYHSDSSNQERKKKMKSTILTILGLVVVFALIYLAGLGAIRADRRERAYWAKLNAHVIETWGDGRDAHGHRCEYDPAWCNPHYAEFLLKNRGGK